MTTKAKPKDDEQPTEQAQPESRQAATKAEAACGAPHFLPALAHIRCQRDEQDHDRAPGTPDHQHRHQVGDTLYQW